MGANTQDKSLIPINENSVFYKIKKFFKNLFYKKERPNVSPIIEETVHAENNSKRNAFIESIKIKETEESQLLNLQQQYNSGKIKEEDLTKEQIDALCDLYKKQNAELRKSNELKKQKLLKYK